MILETIKNGWDRLKYAYKCLLIFILLSIVLCGSIYIVSILAIKKTYEDKYIDLLTVNTLQSSINCNNALNEIKKGVIQVGYSPTFISHSQNLVSTGIVSYQSLGQIKDMLMMLALYNPNIASIIYQSAQNRLIGYDKYAADTGASYLERYLPLLNEPSYLIGDAIHQWIPSTVSPIYGSKSGSLLFYKQYIVDFNTFSLYGTALVGIETTVFKNYVDSSLIIRESNSGCTAIIDENQNIIYCSDKEYISKPLNSYIDPTFAKALKSNPNEVYMFVNNRHYAIEPLALTGWKLVNGLDQKYIMSQTNYFRVTSLVICFILLSISSLISMLVAMRFSKQIDTVVVAMIKAEKGELSSIIKLNTHNEVNFIAQGFNNLMFTINKLINDLKEQITITKSSMEREKLAEIRALEAQINPHFLYNTLNSINWTALLNEQYEISHMLVQLSDMLRYSTSKTNNIVSLKKELVFLCQYLSLQRNRFNDSFDFVIMCDATLRDFKIKKLLFQPFIENSILHGFEGIDSGGLLQVDIKKDHNGNARILIRDNGKGMTTEECARIFSNNLDSPSIGVNNVISRLESYYPNLYRLCTSSDINKGTTIILTIPQL